MTRCILITGNAGLLGSHLGDDLRQPGDAMRVAVGLGRQVPGDVAARERFAPEVALQIGHARDAAVLDRALADVHADLDVAVRCAETSTPIPARPAGHGPAGLAPCEAAAAGAARAAIPSLCEPWAGAATSVVATPAARVAARARLAGTPVESREPGTQRRRCAQDSGAARVGARNRDLHADLTAGVPVTPSR